MNQQSDQGLGSPNAPAHPEKLYDDEIEPRLSDLRDYCMQRGLSFLSVVEWTPGNLGRVLGLAPPSGLGVRLAELAARANGDIDSLILSILNVAQEIGHTSPFLDQFQGLLQSYKSAPEDAPTGAPGAKSQSASKEL